MKIRPALFRWMQVDVVRPGDGSIVRTWTMFPHGRFIEMCRRQYEEREDYALGPVDNISSRSQRHFHAAIRSAWKNLPEGDIRFPTSEHLRKWALVQVNHCTITDFVLDTVKDARRTALALRKADEYAVIIRSGNVVKFCTAKSTSGREMKGEDFQKVKSDVLDLVASLARTDRATLIQQTGTAA